MSYKENFISNLKEFAEVDLTEKILGEEFKKIKEYLVTIDLDLGGGIKKEKVYLEYGGSGKQFIKILNRNVNYERYMDSITVTIDDIDQEPYVFDELVINNESLYSKEYRQDFNEELFYRMLTDIYDDILN